MFLLQGTEGIMAVTISMHEKKVERYSFLSMPCINQKRVYITLNCKIEHIYVWHGIHNRQQEPEFSEIQVEQLRNIQAKVWPPQEQKWLSENCRQSWLPSILALSFGDIAYNCTYQHSTKLFQSHTSDKKDTDTTTKAVKDGDRTHSVFIACPVSESGEL